jgi:DNA-binding MarR family transcriptional regulator
MAASGRTKTFTNGVFHLVRKGYDFNIRNLAVLLAVYSRNELYTVRELAEFLKSNKPSITRALDYLEREPQELIKRRMDPDDRRSIRIGRTEKGTEFMEIFREVLKGNTEVDNIDDELMED